MAPRATSTGASRNLFLAQRFARHVSPLTTTVYTHPPEEEMFQRVRGRTKCMFGLWIKYGRESANPAVVEPPERLRRPST
jgi:hypothetical protein